MRYRLPRTPSDTASRETLKTLSSAQRTRVNVPTTSTNWKQVSHMLWPIDLQTNANGFLIHYVNIRYIRFELASSKARITSVKSLKQESVIQSGTMIRLESHRNDHYSSFNDIVTMFIFVFNHHIAIFVFIDRINHNKDTLVRIGFNWKVTMHCDNPIKSIAMPTWTNCGIGWIWRHVEPFLSEQYFPSGSTSSPAIFTSEIKIQMIVQKQIQCREKDECRDT